jgi:tetratricopeptide (TPR) repeat protein
MSTNIVTKLLNSNPPRRFLEKSDETGHWQEVPLKRAVTKTSQALRDVARDRAKAAAAAAAAAAANKGSEGAGGAVAVKSTSTTSSSTTTSFNNSFNNGSSNDNNGFAAGAGMPSQQFHLPAQNLPPPTSAAAVNNGFDGNYQQQQQQNINPIGGLQQNNTDEDVLGSRLLEELGSGLLDNILTSGGSGGDLVNIDDIDDTFSLDLVGSNAIFGDEVEAIMQQEIALIEWIKSSKIAHSSSPHGVEGVVGGMTTYLESALGIAINLTEYIIKSDDDNHYFVPLECISLENTVVCMKDTLSMAPTPLDATVVIKCQPQSSGGGGGGSGGDIAERLYAVGKILVPLLSGEAGEIVEEEEEADDSSKKASVTMNSMNLNSDDGESLNPPKKKHQMKYHPPAQVEHLDLPQPVMTILSNLLECGQGEFVGDEAYTSFADLLVDLKLLKTEGLSRFLQSPTFEISDKICGREKEVEILNSSFNNRTSCQGVIITGSGGVGKSRIAAHIFQETRKEGGLVFATKFNQNQDVFPLATICVVFNDLINLFATVASPSTLLSLSNDLENALGIHAALLYEVLPSLPRIMPSCTQVRYFVDQTNIANSMRFLLSNLFEILISYQTGRITMLFDDLQWADVASLSLISGLLHSNEGAKRVFFTFCYRDNEVNDSFAAWLQSISGFSLDKIKLESLTRNGVNQFVSATLRLFPRLTRPLSLVLHKKTGGNPLFLGQILSSIGGSGRASPGSSTLSLGDEICISFSLSRRRWTWDIEKIEDLELADDVVSFIVQEMKKLAADLIFGLQVVACIGSMTTDVIEILSAELAMSFTGTNLTDVLHKLAQKGFLNEHICSPKAKECCASGSTLRFEFVHDKIQEAAYESMSSQERRLNHMRFGLALYPQVIANRNDKLLFMAINQINAAGPDSVVDKDQKIIIADLNLDAGKRAGERSDFQTAFSLFQHGLSYLDADCWENHYDTTMALFDSAAQAAVVVNNLEAVSAYSTVINSRAKCLDDKLNCMYVKLKALIHTERFKEAMEYFFEILNDFGEPPLLPVNEIQEDLTAMISVMKGLPDETVLGLSTMTQKKTIVLTKIYCDFAEVMPFIDPSLLPAMTLRNMQLMVQEGLCSKSPLVFAQFGLSCGDMDEAVRLIRLSKKLQQKWGSSDSNSIFTLVYYIMWIAQPFQALTEEAKLSTKISEQSGDVYAATGSDCLVCLLNYITGEPLADLRRKSKESLVQMKDQNMMTFYLLQALFHLQLVALIDGPQVVEAEIIDDVVFGEKEALAEAGTDNFDALLSYEINQLVRAFLFRKFDVLSSSKIFETIPDPNIPIEPYQVVTFFVAGLASYHLARQSEDGENKWMEIGDTMLEKMEGWNKHLTWNFQNKMLLLKAEKMYCVGETESAAILYKESIKSAHDHKFIHEEGMAHELCGHFHLDAKLDRSEALSSFNSAIGCYKKWGALAVARRLEEFVQCTFN